MIDLLVPVASALLAAIIDFARIMHSWGADNISKLWTITIGVIFFAVCLSLSVNYYDEIWPHHVAIYAIYYCSCRGIFYDIMLNILRGLPLDYKSSTTNSKIDQYLYDYDFWMIKVVYLVTATISGYAWQQLLLPSI